MARRGAIMSSILAIVYLDTGADDQRSLSVIWYLIYDCLLNAQRAWHAATTWRQHA